MQNLLDVQHNKARLYWLIDMYLSGKIDAGTFCDEYYVTYDVNLDYNTLTREEYNNFSELARLSGRFSRFEEDHKLDLKAFATEKELKKKILETKHNLSGNQKDA